MVYKKNCSTLRIKTNCVFYLFEAEVNILFMRLKLLRYVYFSSCIIYRLTKYVDKCDGTTAMLPP